VRTHRVVVLDGMVYVQPSQSADGPVTIDLDTADVEAYGRKKRGVAYKDCLWFPAKPTIGRRAELGGGTGPALLRDPRLCVTKARSQWLAW
jgi:hypothetical protein